MAKTEKTVHSEREMPFLVPQDVLRMREYRRDLAIDRTDLDRNLVEQAELYDHVSESMVLAIAERDAAKLDMEEAEAEVARDLRNKSLEEGEKKMAEAAIAQEVKLSPKIKKLSREYLAAKAAVDAWSVLKDSYTQRSYMLREVSMREVARMSSTSSVSSARGDLSDANRGVAGRLRRYRRGVD